MSRFNRILRRLLVGTVPRRLKTPLEQERERTERTASTALVFGFQVRDSELGVMDHSARVALVAGEIAERMGLNEADRHILSLAARLHELGMFAVPRNLLARPAPLTMEELETVRAQARISAEVARLAHPPRVARLIEHQYSDFREVAASERMEERDRILAGILRVADVYAAVTWPRPYQDPMPAAFRDELLESGAGSRFHPLVIQSTLDLSPNALTRARPR